MFQTVKSICIFGAGSAGWVTALSIRHFLPDVQITMINSRKHRNIGVGESTQPDLVELLSKSNIDIDDFLKSVDGTLKHGILYKNWNKPDTEYWHCFSQLPRENMYSRGHHYLKMSQKFPNEFPREDYYTRVHPSYTLAVKNNLSSSDMGFALHMDANKFSVFLQNHLSDSINYIECDEYEIKMSSNKIDSIICDQFNAVTSDLFIDCTGFNKILLSKVSDCETDGYDGNVNSALFCPIQYDKTNVEIFPYTQAEAFDNGWFWTTPLTSRIGSGCVYHDKFCTEEQARKAFIDYWKGAITNDDIRKISYPTEYVKKPWVSNVLAIGLSIGFIEPLEATGISGFIQGVSLLNTLLQNRYYDQDIVDRYNTLTRGYIEDIQDFIDIHYVLSARRDSEFWKYQTSRPRHPRLAARLEVYKKFMPNKNNRTAAYVWAFNDVSWLDILAGYDFKFEDVAVPEWCMAQRHLEIYGNHNV